MKLGPNTLKIIKRLLVGRPSRPLISILRKLEVPDLTSLYSHLNMRESIWLTECLIQMGIASDVLEELPELQLKRILEDLSQSQLLVILQLSTPDLAAYFINHLEEEAASEILRALTPLRRSKISQFLNYPEDSVGRVMQTSVFALPINTTAGQALEMLRSYAQEESIYYIYCVNEENQLIGVISLRNLVMQSPNTSLEEIVKRDVISVTPTTSSEEVAKIVAAYDYIAIPVIDENRKLIGIVTVDDVVDIIQEQATANIYAQAGLQEGDRVYTSASQSLKFRLPWMLINLILAGLASYVVSLFESTMSELIILASLKNIVAGIGGNTAIQTLTVVTRGMATGDFSFISQWRAIVKESYVGLSMGFLLGISGGILVYVWKGDLMVAVILCLAMILNSIVASFFGAIVPLLLKRWNWDPAVGSGPLVTTTTDIFGFFSFLGIAALALAFFT